MVACHTEADLWDHLSLIPGVAAGLKSYETKQMVKEQEEGLLDCMPIRPTKEAKQTASLTVPRNPQLDSSFMKVGGDLEEDPNEVLLKADKQALRKKARDMGIWLRHSLKPVEAYHQRKQIISSVINANGPSGTRARKKKVRQSIRDNNKPWCHPEWDQWGNLNQLEAAGISTSPDDQLLQRPAIRQAIQANKEAQAIKANPKGPISQEHLDLINSRLLQLQIEEEVDKHHNKPEQLTRLTKHNRASGDPRNRPDFIQDIHSSKEEMSFTERIWTQRAKEKLIKHQAQACISLLE